MAVDPFSSGNSAIPDVFPVVRMTSCFRTTKQIQTHSRWRIIHRDSAGGAMGEVCCRRLPCQKFRDMPPEMQAQTHTRVCMCWHSYRSDDHDVRIVVNRVTVARAVSVHVSQRLGGQGPPHGQRPPVLDVVVVADVQLRTGPVAPVVEPRLPDPGAGRRAGARPLGVHRQRRRRRSSPGAATSVGRVRDVGGRDQHGSVEPGR